MFWAQTVYHLFLPICLSIHPSFYLAIHPLALPFFGTGMKPDLFQSGGRCWVSHSCWHIECSTFTTSSSESWWFRSLRSCFWVPRLHLTPGETSPFKKSCVRERKAGEGILAMCCRGSLTWSLLVNSESSQCISMKVLQAAAQLGDFIWFWLPTLNHFPSLRHYVTQWEEPTHWTGPWSWERLRAGGEGGHRGWDGWMASPPQWTWVWASSRSWWWTGKTGGLQLMGSHRVGHNLATEQQQQQNSWTFLRQ